MPGRDGSHPGLLARIASALFAVVVLALIGGLVSVYEFGVQVPGLDLPQRPVDAEPAQLTAHGLELAPPPSPSPVSGVAVTDAGAADPATLRAALWSRKPGPLRDRDLGRRVAVLVKDLATGTLVYDAADDPRVKGAVPATDPITPASTTKLLTSTAALELLGPDTTFETRVLLGPETGFLKADRDPKPPVLTLVGGGDPYLMSKPARAKDDVWPKRADVRTLAGLTAGGLAERGVTRVRLRYDASLFTGPAVSERWRPDYITDGVVSPITALWTDEGRDRDGIGRVDDPAAKAADDFAQALSKTGIEIAGATKPATALSSAGGEQVASVSSPTVARIVQRLLDTSDNEATEVLLRQIGLATGGAGSFEDGIAAVVSTLERLGIDTTGLELYDGSGLSRDNLITPETLAQVLRTAALPDHPELRSVIEGLPVAGFTGSLTARFAAPDAATGLGLVRAKTGTLTGVHALAGLVTDLDGDLLVVVLAADRVPETKSLGARDALDEAAARIAGCHCAPAP